MPRRTTVLARKRTRRRKLQLMAVLCFLLIAACILDSQMRPIIKTIAAYQAQAYATASINNAMLDKLADENINYENLVQIHRDLEGKVTSIQANMIEINRLKTKISASVISCVDELREDDVRIPIGTFSGWQILSGRGPKIKFIILPSGFVQSDIVNEFTSAGINQTRHQIMMEISISITAIVPGYSTSTVVTNNICLAETVIVGDVPQSFTKVETPETSIPGIISDYGADTYLDNTQ